MAGDSRQFRGGEDSIASARSLDDPEYRAQLEYLVEWLADGKELRRLEALVAEVRAHPVKRQPSRYRVRNQDGSIYRKPQRKPSGHQRPRRKNK